MINNVGRFLDLNDKQFFITPKPYEDELLSSWLARLSYAHDTLPSSFLNMHFKEYNRNVLIQRDIDIWADDKFFERLVQKTEFDIEIFRNMSLRSYEGILFDKINPKTRNPFILSLGNKASYKYNKGLRFCPLCLQENLYFKKQWRLSFYAVCEKHKYSMLNECSQCHSSISILRSYQKKYTFDYCYKCGFDLKIV